MVIYKFVQQKSAFKLLCIFLIFFKAGDFCKKNGVNTFLLWGRVAPDDQLFLFFGFFLDIYLEKTEYFVSNLFNLSH